MRQGGVMVGGLPRRRQCRSRRPQRHAIYCEVGNIEAVSRSSHCAEDDLDDDASLLLCSLETIDRRSDDLIE